MAKKDEKRKEIFVDEDEFPTVEDLRRAHRLLEKRLEEADSYESFISGPEFQNIDNSESEDESIYLGMLNSTKRMLRYVCTTKGHAKAFLDFENAALNELEDALKGLTKAEKMTREKFFELAEKMSS